MNRLKGHTVPQAIQPILQKRIVNKNLSAPIQDECVITDSIHFGQTLSDNGRTVDPKRSRTHMKIATAVFSTGSLADILFIAHTIQEWIATHELTSDGQFHIGLGVSILGALFYSGDALFYTDGNRALREKNADHRLLSTRKSRWRAKPEAIYSPTIDRNRFLRELNNDILKPLGLKADIKPDEEHPELLLTRIPVEKKSSILPAKLKAWRNFLLQRRLERNLCEILDEINIALVCNLGHSHIVGGHQH